MDKVIIDGVDVSGCKHYRAEIETKMPYGEYEILKDKCHYSGIEIIQDCKGIKGCIYKQLKRLEQENETLERTNNELRKRFSEDTTKLSAELKELKADIESRTMCITCERELQNCNLKAENERLKEQCYTLNRIAYENIEKYAKIKFVLQEIRDIAKEISREKVHNPDIDTIIAKINEVIGAE